MVPGTAIAAVADIFPPEGRGKAIGWIITATGISATIGIAMVAFLLDVGGWRLPFYVIGGVVLALWALLWVWFPHGPVAVVLFPLSGSRGQRDGLVCDGRQRAVANCVFRSV